MKIISILKLLFFGLFIVSCTNSNINSVEENEIFNQSPKEKLPNSPSGKRRSSLAVLTQDSCKIS